jgi:hypothetical protein
MSNAANKLLLAAAGNAGEAVYVDDLFSTFLYEGTASTQTITNGIDLAGEGGLVWIKNRDNTGGSGYHFWFDTARSPTNSDAMYFLRSDSDVAQETLYYSGSNRDFAGWASNGFTLGSPYALPQSSLNGSSEDEFCSWTFRKAEKFFDVVTYSGTGSAQNISHNLGSVPGMIIVKRTSGTEDWIIYHRSTGNGKGTGFQSNATYTSTAYWNSTTPTDSVFTVGTHDRVNTSGHTYVAYLFAHDEQDFGTGSDEAIIKCGSYTANGNDNGPVIDLGFEPQWVMIKDTNASTDWFQFDTMRNWNVVNASELKPNTSASEAAVIGAYRWLKPLSNGFQITDAATGLNTSGNTHIYMAIRRPHKPASKFAATDLFSMDAAGATSSNPCFVSNGHVVDMAWEKQEAANTAALIFSRLTGSKYLNTTSTGTESTGSSVTWDYMNGCLDGFGGADTYQAWMFRRAPGFFDVVAYTGTGSDLTVNHNLGATPELIIVKNRNRSENWPVYHSGDSSKYYFLNTTTGGQSNNRFSSITASSFVAEGGSNDVNSVYEDGHVAYLFATVAGISKVGTYSGTGSDVNVDCGFSSGARFVLIKRSDSTGDWYYYDSVRGIVAGNDPYLFLNTTAAQVTNTDYIDPLSSGFTITSSAPAALNTSGGTYLFLAIA